ncbi:hypothetical protein BU17DRAFT_60366 [Hysterangium stoloniferum]|nr:hypothetical protein BU17DRAFT_60366 [Hysterangium stoloniferum]
MVLKTKFNKKQFRLEYPPKEIRAALLSTPLHVKSRKSLRMSMIRTAQVYASRAGGADRLPSTPRRSSIKDNIDWEALRTPVRVPSAKDSTEEMALLDGTGDDATVVEEADLIILERVNEKTKMRVNVSPSKQNATILTRTVAFSLPTSTAPPPKAIPVPISAYLVQATVPHTLPHRRQSVLSLRRAVVLRSYNVYFLKAKPWKKSSSTLGKAINARCKSALKTSTTLPMPGPLNNVIPSRCLSDTYTPREDKYEDPETMLKKMKQKMDSVRQKSEIRRMRLSITDSSHGEQGSNFDIEETTDDKLNLPKTPVRVTPAHISHTPRFDGVREMFQQPRLNPGTPSFAGVKEMYQHPTMPLNTPSFCGIKEMYKAGPSSIPATPHMNLDEIFDDREVKYEGSRLDKKSDHLMSLDEEMKKKTVLAIQEEGSEDVVQPKASRVIRRKAPTQPEAALPAPRGLTVPKTTKTRRPVNIEESNEELASDSLSKKSINVRRSARSKNPNMAEAETVPCQVEELTFPKTRSGRAVKAPRPILAQETVSASAKTTRRVKMGMLPDVEVPETDSIPTRKKRGKKTKESDHDENQGLPGDVDGPPSDAENIPLGTSRGCAPRPATRNNTLAIKVVVENDKENGDEPSATLLGKTPAPQGRRTTAGAPAVALDAPAKRMRSRKRMIDHFMM